MPVDSEFVYLTQFISIVAGLFTLFSLIYAGQPWNMGFQLIFGWIGLFVGFGAWAVSPYIMLSTRIRKPNITFKQSIAYFIGCLLVASYGVYCLVEMFIHPDAQGGLIFIFLPVYQWIGVTITIGIAGRWAEPK